MKVTIEFEDNGTATVSREHCLTLVQVLSSLCHRSGLTGEAVIAEVSATYDAIDCGPTTVDDGLS